MRKGFNGIDNNKMIDSLICSVEGHDIVAIKKYLAEGVDPTASGSHIWSAMDRAVMLDDVSMVRILLAEVGDINNHQLNDWNSIHRASFFGCKCLQALIDHGGDASRPTSIDKLTPLILAARSGEIGSIATLLNAGASIDSQYSNSKTAFYEAIENRNLDAAEILFRAGADPWVMNFYGGTAIDFVMKSNDFDALKMLLDNISSRNLISSDLGETMLSIAIQESSRSELIELLLDGGADVNDSDADGNTALILASDRDKKSVCGILIDHGANPFLTNNNGDTAISLAKKNNHNEVAALIECAFFKHDIERIKGLGRKGIDVELKL